MACSNPLQTDDRCFTYCRVPVLQANGAKDVGSLHLTLRARTGRLRKLTKIFHIQISLYNLLFSIRREESIGKEDLFDFNVHYVSCYVIAPARTESQRSRNRFLSTVGIISKPPISLASTTVRNIVVTCERVRNTMAANSAV